MSSEVIKDFFVRLGFKEDPSLKKFETSLKSMGTSVLKWGSLLTGGAIAGAFADIVHEADKLDKLAKLSFRVNASVEEIEKLGYVAQISGASIEDVKSSLEGLSSAAGQTAMGVGRAKKVFDTLGISVTDANGNVKDSLELMSEVGKRITSLSKAEQISVLDKVGISRNLLQSITTDVSDLEAEFDSMYKTAGIDSNEAAKKAEKFNDSLFRLKFAFGAVSQKASTEFFDSLTEGSDVLRKMIVQVMPKVLSVVVPALKILITGFEKFTHIIAGFFVVFNPIAKAVVDGFNQINDLSGGLLGNLALITAALWLFDAALEANPIVLLVTGIVAAVAAIGLLIDDFQTFKEGGKAYINWAPFIKGLDMVGAGFNYIWECVKGLLHPVETFVALLGKLSTIWDSVKEKIGLGKGNVGITVQDVATNGVPIVSNGAVSNSNKNVTYNNPITITVSGASSPTDTANAISATQSRLSQNMVRNMQGNVR